MNRTDAYRFTVRMQNGKVHPQDEGYLDVLRDYVSTMNRLNGTLQYVKLQGRLGKDNPNSWKYRQYRNGGIYGRAQCVRLADAATADVYVYNR